MNKVAVIADYVQGGNTVIFTRNGYGCIVTMSFDAYKRLNGSVISELNRADELCESDTRQAARAECALYRFRSHGTRDPTDAATVAAWPHTTVSLFYGCSFHYQFHDLRLLSHCRFRFAGRE